MDPHDGNDQGGSLLMTCCAFGSPAWFWRLVVVVLFSGSILRVYGDGRVFPSERVDPVVLIPDQRALIQFENGLERLVIETSYRGAGTNFAWVIPLPAVPQIQPASPDLFNSLQSAFRPRLIHQVRNYWLLWLVAGGWFFLVVRSVRDEVSWVNDLPWCLVMASLVGLVLKSPWLGGIILVFTLLVRMSHVPLGIAVITLFFLMAWGLQIFWLPMERGGFVETLNAMGDGSSPPDTAVTIHRHQRVGIFDTRTISSQDPAALRRWLSTNGYAMPEEAAPIIAGYVREGWCFVVTKIYQETAATLLTTPHPLDFTFPASNAVYPLQLTGLSNPSCLIDLYVFGNQRAANLHFKVVSCRKIGSDRQKARRLRGEFPLALDAAVAPLAGSATVGTLLRGKLSSRDMRADAPIRWRDFHYRHPLVFSRPGAALISINLVTGLVVIGWLSVWLMEGSWGVTQNKQLTWYIRMLIAAIVMGLLVYAVLPTTDIEIQPLSRTGKDAQWCFGIGAV